MHRKNKKKIPKIILFTDDKNSINPITLAKYIPINWGLLIRNYKAINRNKIITEAANICKQRNIFFIIANDLNLAISVNASGIHLSETFIKNTCISPILYHTSKLILTTSIHNFYGLNLFTDFKPDAVFLSPLQRTPSHPNVKPLGLFRFLALAKKISIPTYALGGLDLKNYNRLTKFGISGIAGISLSRNIIQNFNLTPRRAPFWGESICNNVLSRSK